MKNEISQYFFNNFMKIQQIKPQDHIFTENLQYYPNPVKRLYYRGELPETRIPTVAIVGARKPTTYGRAIAQKIASEVALRGGIVISGMALGIDGIAHKAAMNTGGITLAVLANGVDKFYPSSHAGLGMRILETGGAIISEYEPGTPALPFQFLERNRIVSGLADAVVVVEAATRSGTLSTANHALDQGKEVFAVPGNITSPLSAGCNKLIKQGAQPLTEVQDLLDFLFPKTKESRQISLLKGDTPAENKILELLAQGVKNGDILLQKSELSTSEFNQAITMLEIKGLISGDANNWSLK